MKLARQTDAATNVRIKRKRGTNVRIKRRNGESGYAYLRRLEAAAKADTAQSATPIPTEPEIAEDTATPESAPDAVPAPETFIEHAQTDAAVTRPEPIRVHIYNGARSTELAEDTAQDLPAWPAFVDAIRLLIDSEASDKRDLPAICAVELRPGTTRANANIDRVTVGLLDFDHVGDVDAMIGRLAGLDALVYATPSDLGEGATERRVRVCVALERPLLPREVGPWRLALAAEIGELLDSSTVDPARLSFVGRLTGTAARQIWTTEGTPCPVGDLLALCQAPVIEGGSSLAPVVSDRDLSAEERARLDRIAAILQPHYVPGGPDCPSNTHQISRAIAGWLRHKGMPRAAAEYLILECLPTSNPEQKAKTIDWAYDVASNPDGWRLLARELPPDVVHAIDAAELKPQWQIDLNQRRAQQWGAVANDASAEAETPAPSELRTDLGNARRLVRMHGPDLRYVAARGVWLAWDGARWVDDETGEITRRAKSSLESLWDEARSETDDDKRKSAFAYAAKCQGRALISNAVELAKTEPGVAVRVAELDADPWSFNAPNGTLDLRTKELRAPDRASLMTKCCGAPYVPGSRSDLWDAFVHRTFGGDADLISYVQRALGYALFGAWREKHFWFGYGPGDGGKSTFFGAVAHALGDYHTTAAASTWLVQSSGGGNRGDLVRLLGARLVTTSEIREGARVDEEIVKRITGGDPIVAAAKYEGEIEFRPTFALWWFANDAPTIRDDDNAMWIRARVVPFTNVVPKREQDIELPSKLARPEHASAVLAWLVDGCVAWRHDGLGSCAAVDEASRAYRGSMNRLAAFVDAHLIVTGDAADEVPNKRMRAVYEDWCRTNGVRAPLQGKAFGARLRELGVLGGDDASKKPVKCEGPPRSVAMKRTEQDRHWRGVRIEGVNP